MIRQIYRSVGVAVLLFFACLVTHAQDQLVTGTIKDPEGMPMPGVNVLIKGTSTGTSSDTDGKFSLQASPDDVLVVSFIGYKTQEVPVGARTNIDITVQEDLTTLDELVVVGYGEQKKALTTGANLNVKGEDLQKLSTTNALQALQGQAPGVQISPTSGQPGEPFKVVIRGLGTIGGGNPLYVVDGVLTGDIAYLNPADIQSVDVLKDAASAAIYGSQAANGVVFITTKKGKKGSAAQITFDGFYGVQNVPRKVRLLNAREYMTLRNEAAVNSGKLPYYSADSIANAGEGTNWLDKVFVDNAPTMNYSLGVTGGSQESTYSAGLSYLKQAGIVGGEDISSYTRYNFRFNSEHNLYKNRVVLGQNLSFAHEKSNGIAVGGQYNNPLRSAFSTSPILPDNRQDTVGGPFNEANPYMQMYYNSLNVDNTQRVVGNVYLQIEPIRNLTFRSTIGMDYSAGEAHSYTPEYTLSIYTFNRPNRLTQNLNKNRSLVFDNLLTYTFDLNQHNFNIMAGTSAYQYSGTFMYGSNVDVVFNDLEHAWLDNATNQDGARMTLSGGANNPNKRLSFFGRVNYNFDETYLINATFRADGSSQFAEGNRWGYFPSIAAGWVMTNSEFLSSQSWIDFLKLRVSWGQVGNQNAGDFQYLAPIRTENTNYSFGPSEGTEGLVPGAYPSRLPNPKLKWETSQQTNIGIDARLMGGKVTATLDYYVKTSKDWLIIVPVLATAGADAPYINGGNAVNKGIEVSLGYNNSIGDLNYHVNVNGAFNKNDVTDIPTGDRVIHGLNSPNQLFNNAPAFYRAEEGYPIGYFWGFRTNGIFQTQEEVAAYVSDENTLIQPNAQPGDVRYVDINNDGVIDTKDKTMIGSPIPDYTFGFNIGADYKGFDLTIQAFGQVGNEIVQSYRNHSSNYGNWTSEILDRWHGPGSSNRMPRLTENNNNWTEFSDLYIHDGDFLRISNVTLGYNLSRFWNQKFVSHFRVYASALNLFTFTKYNGMDPEVGYGPDAFSSSVDLGYYPRPRTLLVGVNVKF